MQKLVTTLFILFSLIASSCSTGTSSSTPVIISIYSTLAAEPWLVSLSDCTGSGAILSRVDDPSDAEIALRVGEPEILSMPAFQIGTEEILIVTHRQSPIQNLTLGQARMLFSQGNPSVQVWVYSSGEEVQQAFDQFVMDGRNITPSARVAVSPQQMSDTLVNESNTVGILPRHWKTGDVREVYSVATIPVLALTKSKPQGLIKELIACLQK